MRVSSLTRVKRHHRGPARPSPPVHSPANSTHLRPPRGKKGRATASLLFIALGTPPLSVSSNRS